jgi:hypothetical protein
MAAMHKQQPAAAVAHLAPCQPPPPHPPPLPDQLPGAAAEEESDWEGSDEEEDGQESGPARYDRRRFACQNDSLGVFGPVIASVSFSQGIAAGRLLGAELQLLQPLLPGDAQEGHLEHLRVQLGLPVSAEAAQQRQDQRQQQQEQEQQQQEQREQRQRQQPAVGPAVGPSAARTRALGQNDAATSTGWVQHAWLACTAYCPLAGKAARHPCSGV